LFSYTPLPFKETLLYDPVEDWTARLKVVHGKGQQPAAGTPLPEQVLSARKVLWN